MGDDELLLSIARRYGTPTYVFDTDTFRKRIRAVKAELGDGVTLCYSMKANPFLAGVAREEGLAVEVCSPGELMICESIDMDPAAIVYSGVCKQLADAREAMWYGVGVMTAESPSQLSLIDRIAEDMGIRIPVLLRLSAGSQFGMTRDDLRSIVARRGEYGGIDLVGIHYFVGTQRDKARRQVRELNKLLSLIDELELEFGWRAERLEYGPGLAVPYFEGEDFSDTLRPMRELADTLHEVARHVDLTVEMGRFLASECGWYLTGVVDMKDGDGIRYAFVDGGINHVSYHGQAMGMRRPLIRNLSSACGESATDAEGGREGGEWCLCGSLCTTNDVLVRSLPLEIGMGDVIALGRIGAYSVTEGIYLFLSRDLPYVVMLRDGEPTLARNAVQTAIVNTPNVEVTLG